LHRLLASLDVKGKGKLGPKFLGPFKVLDKVGTIAYRLELPAGTKLHDIFHVGLLKSFRGEPPSVPGTLPPICHGRACIEPSFMDAIGGILQARSLGSVERVGSNRGFLDAIGGILQALSLLSTPRQADCPGGRDVMVGITYKRRRK
jgi:hypothetical protein